MEVNFYNFSLVKGVSFYKFKKVAPLKALVFFYK